LNLDHWFEKADAARWLTREEFRDALLASVRKSFPEGEPHDAQVDRYISALHVADLALATACALGREDAWDHFVLAHRAVLYRAADALSPSGGAREIADALYADLYGLEKPSGARRSLFLYFHGRSSLATWLRSVLAQRFVDSLRALRRTEPLDDEDLAIAKAARGDADPDRDRLVPLVEHALRAAIARLVPNDRLRLRSYYVSQLTLAEIGRITGEHEATVSRQLARTRRRLRDEVERHLRNEGRLTREQTSRALELAIEDPGSLSLQQMFGRDRKNPSHDRSRDEG
jgi:RNA polymerase sigma-70 factor (ECF subfamily)